MERLYCTYTPKTGILIVNSIGSPLDRNWSVHGIPNCTLAAVTELLNEGGFIVDEWIENSDLYSEQVHVAKIRKAPRFQ